MYIHICTYIYINPVTENTSGRSLSSSMAGARHLAAMSLEVLSEIQSATPDTVTNLLTAQNLNAKLRAQGMSESTGMSTNVRYVSLEFFCPDLILTKVEI